MAAFVTRVVLSALCLMACCPVQAAPVAAGSLGGVSATERPYTLAEVEAKKKLASFGLCNAPQNADASPTQPVAVQEDTCSYFQHYEATSAAPSNGGSCGGFTVALGPMGDLKTTWKRHTLKAAWGDAPLTQAQCSKARLAAVAWGARCLNDACTSTQWEKIGAPLLKQGTWYANGGFCALEHWFSDTQHHYKTLNIDVIATYQEGSQGVRKRARASIRGESPNAKCASVNQGPRPPAPAQVASQAGATYQPQRKP